MVGVGFLMLMFTSPEPTPSFCSDSASADDNCSSKAVLSDAVEAIVLEEDWEVADASEVAESIITLVTPVGAVANEWPKECYQSIRCKQTLRNI